MEIHAKSTNHANSGGIYITYIMLVVFQISCPFSFRIGILISEISALKYFDDMHY